MNVDYELGPPSCQANTASILIIYKIYAESFRGEDHLRSILEEARIIVNDALRSSLP